MFSEQIIQVLFFGEKLTGFAHGCHPSYRLPVVVRRTTLKYMVANVLVIITTYEENRVNIAIELQIKNQAERFVSKV